MIRIVDRKDSCGQSTSFGVDRVCPGVPGPKISFLCPVYGAERYIGRCARSLFGQTYDNLEFIFVNDCTKDNSIEILREVAREYPRCSQQLRIIDHDVNKGVGQARNTLVGAATGDFLVFVDADDYVDADLAQRLADEQLRTGADIILYDTKVVGNDDGDLTDSSDGGVGAEAGDKVEYEVGRNIDRTASEKDCAKLYYAPDCTSVREYLVKLLHRDTPLSLWGKMLRTSLLKDHDIKVECGVNFSEDYMVLVRTVYHARSISSVHGSYYYYETGNEQSVTARFSARKVHDDFKAFDFLDGFFRDKGALYEDFKVGVLQICTQHLRTSVLCGDRECYLESRSRIRVLGKPFVSRMLPQNRMLYHAGFGIARVYVGLKAIFT